MSFALDLEFERMKRNGERWVAARAAGESTYGLDQEYRVIERATRKLERKAREQAKKQRKMSTGGA